MGPTAADPPRIEAERQQDESLFGGYSPDQSLPLVGYCALMAIFSGGVAVFLVALRGSGRELPERTSIGDVVLLGAATYKATRLASKDLVTSPLRAPFTRFEELSGPNEVKESARGSGMRQAVGELLICPYCLGVWVAAAFVAAHGVAPRTTRLMATILGVSAISDELYNRTS